MATAEPSVELSRALDELKAMLKAGPPLKLAVLFGSAAKGRLQAASDLDLGVLPGAEWTLGDELDLAARLTRATGREVDLVRLDSASSLVRWEVARAHILILAEPQQELARFLARAALEHAEMADLLSDVRARVLRRLTAGAHSRSVTDATVILRKLMTLREYVHRARDRRPSTPEVLRDDLLLQDALAMTLLVAGSAGKLRRGIRIAREEWCD